MSKNSKAKPTENNKKDEDAELESQFILRLPEEAAGALHELIQSGSNNLKDRLSIKTEPDLRYGEVIFDNCSMHTKIVDLPTIIESLKTIDNKSFYKTADISQMMICKYEPDSPSADEESPNKPKKKDPYKVEKKFLWPHGITPPTKNIRKRRFRKTLKKKYVEAPEIEKEVKRLLRADNEAISVKYEIITEEAEHNAQNINNDSNKKSSNVDTDKTNKLGKEKVKHNDSLAESEVDIDTEQLMPLTQRGVGEHDIFGGEVSSSDDEEQRNVEIEEISRLSQEDSRLTELSENAAAGISVGLIDNGNNSNQNEKVVTEFEKAMFDLNLQKDNTEQFEPSTSRKFYENQQRKEKRDLKQHPIQGYSKWEKSGLHEPKIREQIPMLVVRLRREIENLKTQHAQKSQEISSIQNQTLRQRMQETRDNLLSQIANKEMEIQCLEDMFDEEETS